MKQRELSYVHMKVYEGTNKDWRQYNAFTFSVGEASVSYWIMFVISI